MSSIRYVVAACAFAFAATASASAPKTAFSNGAIQASASVSESSYWEKFEGVVADMPVQGFTYPTMSVRYAGTATTGVRQTMHAPSLCPNFVSNGNLGGAERTSPVDIAIDFKVPATAVFFALCARYPLKEDATVDFLTTDGTSVQKNVYKAGGPFNELVDYSGSAPISSVVIHASGQVIIDNVHHTYPN
jgi:hypothetical protein